jgi:glucose/arabinose dehydrogenase
MKKNILIKGIGLSCMAIMLVFSSCEDDDENLPEAQIQSQILSTQEVATGLTSPVTLLEAPDNSKRLFVVDQIGLIKIITPGTNAMLATPFLDVRSKITPLSPSYDERGLLGLAFHPQYATNGKFFVYYTAPLRGGAPAGWDHTNVVSQFTVSETDSNVANVSSEKIILQVDHPQVNHNGGTVAFGPDNYLYISIGDGGNYNDEGLGHVNDWYTFNAGGNGQDVTQNLLGNILRLNVDAGAPYAIPSDNPFVGVNGLDEIYAYGFRNPYRFSFDKGGSNALYVGDAGQELYEEISIVSRGGNYGWNIKEGTHCFNAADSLNPPASCPTVDSAGNALIDPIIELKNIRLSGGYGVVIVGGYVYRGTAVNQLANNYVFGVFSRNQSTPDGRIFIAPTQQSASWNFQELMEIKLNQYLLGFGQDNSGEVYVLSTTNLGPTGNTGKVLKLVNQ